MRYTGPGSQVSGAEAGEGLPTGGEGLEIHDARAAAYDSSSRHLASPRPTETN
jgi:hypothetical protein